MPVPLHSTARRRWARADRAVLVPVVLCAVLAAAVGAAQATTASDRNAEGIPLSAVDQTMGIGAVAKTLPSPPDANTHGIPLSALDQTLWPNV
jgi:hypothetical protein